MGVGGGSARPRPLEQGACARAESSKTHEETNEEDEARPATPQKPLSPSAQPPKKGRLLLTRCPRGWEMESGRNYFASKPKAASPVLATYASCGVPPGAAGRPGQVRGDPGTVARSTGQAQPRGGDFLKAPSQAPPQRHW